MASNSRKLFGFAALLLLLILAGCDNFFIGNNDVARLRLAR